MGAIKQIKVDGVTYDIKATQDADGNVINTTYAKINELNNKVDKIEGKSLSEKDFTTALYNKLNGIADNANNYTHPTGSATSKASGLYKFSTDATSHISAVTAVSKTDITALGIPAQDTTYTVATTSANGLMSSTDKAKLDGIATGANNYVHPTGAGNSHIPAGGSSGLYLVWSAAGTAVWGNAPSSTISLATSDTLGGVKIGYSTSGKNYAVQLDGSGKAFVNVPWTDANTTYSIATATTPGLVKSSTTGTTSDRDYKVEINSDGTMKVNVPWTDNNTTYSAATSSTLGLVKQGAVIQDINTIDATGPDVAQAFNNLLAVLRTAGIIANK